MAKFKNNVSDGWLFKQELRLFRNFLSNWKYDVTNSRFFATFNNDNNTTVETAKAMLKRHFSLEELAKLDGISVERESSRECESRRIVDFALNRRSIDDLIYEIWNRKELRQRCREMLAVWCDAMERRKTRTCRHKDPLETRVEEIRQVLKLNDIECDLLIYAIVRAMTCFDDFPTSQTNGRNDKALFSAMAIDQPCSAVTKALSAEGRLRTFEVLDSDGDLSRGPFRSYLEEGGTEMLDGRFYRKVSTDDTLPWNYYGKLAEEHGTILRDMIASDGGAHGLNILLYGEAGTGKTSFTKSLAKELGRELFEIRQGDRDNRNGDSPQCRMAGIRICNGQVPRERSMILVDEADQLLRTSMDFFASFFGGMGSSGSEKGVINSILDETKIPTIWISNTPAKALDDSVRRRFDYSIRFEKLTSRQRESIWRNTIEKLHMGRLIPSTMVEEFARKYQTSAGGIAMVLENVKRMRPRKADVPGLVDRLMKPHCELMGTQTRNDELRPSADYSLEGLNIRGDMALDRIVEAVRRFREEKDDGADPDRPRMNLLLWGPPGTGKTEFVKHLGKTLDAKVSIKMGSDILSMWVGGTEKNIRRAFEEAEADNAILFLDEIDGLVQDRSGAHQSWEVTQVNELLYRMENFKGVMVAATNFMANLDAAILRRFTFKLQFDYLDEAGKRLFFERMFRTALTAEESARLMRIRNLAPGDFRTVRQSLYYLGGDASNAMRLDGLEKESALKKGAARPLGF